MELNVRGRAEDVLTSRTTADVGATILRESEEPGNFPLERAGDVQVSRLTADDVRAIRERLSVMLSDDEDAFGAPAALYPDRLESAVGRQDAGYGGVLKYRSVTDVAATLFYGLVMNHPFENGNKRTALVTLLVFLDRNRLTLENTTEAELYNLVTQVADHAFPLPHKRPRNQDSEVVSISEWIAERRCRLTIGDKNMEYSVLANLLRQHGCEFEKPFGNQVKIRRGPYSTKLGYPGRDYDVQSWHVRKVRKDLRLDERSGTDSGAFYDVNPRVDSFVQRHRQLLKRLAQT